MRVLHLTRRDSVHAECRRLVEAGEPDAPFEVHYDGRHCLTYPSLHRAALRTVVEEPACRAVDWKPHPQAVVGPRMLALLAGRMARKAGRASQPPHNHRSGQPAHSRDQRQGGAGEGAPHAGRAG